MSEDCDVAPVAAMPFVLCYACAYMHLYRLGLSAFKRKLTALIFLCLTNLCHSVISAHHLVHNQLKLLNPNAVQYQRSLTTHILSSHVCQINLISVRSRVSLSTNMPSLYIIFGSFLLRSSTST